MLKKLLYRFVNNQRGSVIVVVAVLMTGLLGGAALVTDIGVNYVIQGRLSIAADAAALAAGTKFGLGHDLIRETAVTTAEKNGVPAERVFVEINDEGNAVTVRTQAPMQLYFARIFGAEGGMMEQRARVAKTRPTAFFDVFPLGMDEDVDLIYSQRVNLFSEGLLGGSNWGALTFPDENGNYMTGASIFREFTKYGYDGLIEIDDVVIAKSGVNMGPIRDGINFRFAEAAKTHECTLQVCPSDCPRIVILPVYNKLEGDEVVVVDFAAFWIESLSGQGSNTEVWGYFIRPHVNPAASVEGESPYGMTATRLLQ